jgi:small subunit ribosomal protein S3Ae
MLTCSVLIGQVHGDYSEEVGAKIDRPVVGDDAEPDAAEAVPVPGA